MGRSPEYGHHTLYIECSFPTRWGALSRFKADTLNLKLGVPSTSYSVALCPIVMHCNSCLSLCGCPFSRLLFLCSAFIASSELNPGTHTWTCLRYKWCERTGEASCGFSLECDVCMRTCLEHPWSGFLCTMNSPTVSNTQFHSLVLCTSFFFFFFPLSSVWHNVWLFHMLVCATCSYLVENAQV